MKWFIKCLRQYFDFKGRARRKEYWMFYLWTFLIELVICLISFLLGGGVPGIGYEPDVPPELMPRNIGMGMFFTGLVTLYGYALIIPQISVSVRRLHDTGKSGWWLLGYYLIMIATGIVLSLFSIQVAVAGRAAQTWPVWVALSVMAVAVIWWLVLMVKKGDVGRNKYGEDPKGTF